MNKNKKQPVIINDLTLVSPDRNRKDVGKLKAAIMSAERIQAPNRYALYDLYHDVVTIDGHLAGILAKRTGAVTNKRLRFTRNQQSVNELDALINSEKFTQLISLIMDSIYWGISGVEFIVGKQFDFNVIPRKHIRVEDRLIVKSQYDNSGISLDLLPYCWIIGGDKRYNFGRLLQCSMYALYKRSGFGDFAQYVEIFGQPVRVIRYDTYDQETKAELKRIADESGSSLVMMIPKQAEFEMLDGKSSNGSGELQERLIRACNQEMSIAILGVSETTVSSSSSGYAQAEVHAEQQFEVTRDDMRFVLHMLNSDYFLSILAAYGYPVAGGQFEYVEEKNLDMLTKRLNIDVQQSNIVPISDDYFYETYGIPKPDNYEAIKADQQARRDAAIKAAQLAVANNKDDKNDKDDKVKPNKNLFDTLVDFFA